jgi:hypothetical protein
MSHSACQPRTQYQRVRPRQVQAPRPRTVALRCRPTRECRSVRQSTHHRRVPARHKCASRRLRGRQTPRQQPVHHPGRRRDGNEGIRWPCSQFSQCSRLRCSGRTPSNRKTPASRAARSQRARPHLPEPRRSDQCMVHTASRGPSACAGTCWPSTVEMRRNCGGWGWRKPREIFRDLTSAHMFLEK